MTTSATPDGVHGNDDAVTICAISMLGWMLSDVLHEGLGHALLALLTGAQSGVLSAVAWSSAFDSRLVAAGGTLVNLAAALVLWLVLRSARQASPRIRFFLLMSCAFNLLDGTGYFFFSGVTDFGDWAVVIAGMNPHWVWRVLLVIFGMAAYLGAVRLVGSGLVRYAGVAIEDHQRMRRLTVLPYVSAILVSLAAGLMNPIGIQLVWQSSLPATAGANSGLLWLRPYIPKATVPESGSDDISRSYAWVAVAAVCALLFIFVVGRGITLHRW
jgi:hypothetical protein